MKILVIFTGGTIGSAVSDGWITPDSSRSYLLLEQYKKDYPSSDIEFDTAEPFNVLSENISAENISSLIACVTENAKKGYDGIIVTHGTDTLQYSAAAIGYAVANTLPVVLVSSNFELEDERTNGHVNFAAAVELIRAGEKGVFVSYCNNDGVTYYHHASRLLRHCEVNDDVFSLLQPYGSFVEGKFKKNPEFTGGEVSAPVGNYSLNEKSGILNILCHPGNSFGYDLSCVKAILLQPYHSGTLNTENPNLALFCEKAEKVGIPIFLTNLPGGMGYSSNKNLDELHIIRLPLCGAIPIYMKLWLGVSQNKNLEEFVKTPIYEEFIL